MKLSITHDTTYNYVDQVRSSIQYLRLTPQDSKRQRVIDWDLQLPAQVRAQRDPYGNILHVLTLETPHDSLVIRASGHVEIDESQDCEYDEVAPYPYMRSTRLTEADQALREFAGEHCQAPYDRRALIGLMHALANAMTYVPGSTEVDSTAAEAFACGTGVCQDHAHAFIACVRSLGLAARYVSGYLCSEDTEHLSSHAWAEVWLDGAWYTFDVTNGMSRPERHLKLAVGLDYLDACPVRGMRRGGGGEQMQARVLVNHLVVQQEHKQEQKQVQKQQ
jgi:transglutaminase-like putative cysteine protease